MRIQHLFVTAVAATTLIGAVACSKSPTDETETTASAQMDDAAVLASVKSKLITDPVTQARQIDVEVENGIVQLNGFVDSEAEKSQAATLASAVEGVVEVRNNLSVNAGPETLGGYVDDSALTAKVKAALIESPDTKAHEINVETMEGVVQLSGFVDNLAAKDAATTVAKSVEGVKEVQNEITLKPTT
jgi:hyperosmotically inducible protein